MKKLSFTIFLLTSIISYAKESLSPQIILVGEQHGKKEQIEAASALMTQYYSPQNTALALEHISQKQQDKLSNWLQDYKNPDQLAIDIKWWQSGWPNWMIYRPLFQTAYQLNMPLIATDETRILPSDEIQNIWGDHYAHAYQAWELIIKDYHKQDIEAKKLHELVILQMSRDIHMAEAIKQYLNKHPKAKIIFFAGQDHIRNNYSIPSLLKDYQSFSIALNCPKFDHIFNHIIPQCNIKEEK